MNLELKISPKIYNYYPVFIVLGSLALLSIREVSKRLKYVPAYALYLVVWLPLAIFNIMSVAIPFST